MSSENHSAKFVRFGVFEVDLRSGELLKHGVRLRLQEQPFQVLLMLLERPGETVTREELRKCTWPTLEELKGSTVVVTISIILLGGFTVGVDFVFAMLVRWIA